jgi:hypothetical protein
VGGGLRRRPPQNPTPPLIGFWYTRRLIVTPPQALWGIDKKGTFPQFLIFFTFARRTKKITFFFVRNWTKKCTLSLSHLKITFSKFTFFTLCFKVRKWKQRYIKNCKIVSFFPILTAHIRAGKCKMCIYTYQ